MQGAAGPISSSDPRTLKRRQTTAQAPLRHHSDITLTDRTAVLAVLGDLAQETRPPALRESDQNTAGSAHQAHRIEGLADGRREGVWMMAERWASVMVLVCPDGSTNQQSWSAFPLVKNRPHGY